ncbi:MAG: ATP-binding protein, partial [Lachnospiraceae bacterium]|nr:ATP-binding protein [Lachnospiraceae bacterium]
NPVGIVLTLLLTAGYVCLFWKRLPGNLDEFMLLKPDFGVPAEDRLDLMIRDMDQVSITAETVQRFYAKHGFTGKTAFYAALCLEEMAGNVVTHGFSADKKDHIAEVKVIIKGEDITLRLKDDCIPFDPKERAELVSEDDPARNIGLRMVTRFSKEMTYQNMMGLNVLTIGLKDTDYGR